MEGYANFLAFIVIYFGVSFFINADWLHYQQFQKMTFNKNAKKYFCCCGSIHVSKGAVTICIFQLLYAGTIVFFDFQYTSSNSNIIVDYFNLLWIPIALLATIIKLFNGRGKSIAAELFWPWPYDFVFCIFNIMVSLDNLRKSFIGLLFLNDKKEMLKIVTSNIHFYLPEELHVEATYYVLSFSGERNYLYYFLAILVAKDLAFMILNLWFLMIFWRFIKYLLDWYESYNPGVISIQSDDNFNQINVEN